MKYKKKNLKKLEKTWVITSAPEILEQSPATLRHPVGTGETRSGGQLERQVTVGKDSSPYHPQWKWQPGHLRIELVETSYLSYVLFWHTEYTVKKILQLPLPPLQSSLGQGLGRPPYKQ